MANPADEITVYGKKRRGGNEVAIQLANGLKIAGWVSVRISRSVERCPPDFDISLAERYPGANEIVVTPGMPCVVSIGDTTVLTGHVDRYMASIAGDAHTVQIIGRGKTQDLVDCSAIWQGGAINGSGPIGIANKLGSIYGITAELGSGQEPTDPLPTIQLSYGETPYALLERIARFYGLLIYEDSHGTLIFDRVGTVTAAGGITQGVNVEAASVAYGMDHRYSEYRVMAQSIERADDVSIGGDLIFTAKDPNVPRTRIMALISEAGYGGQQIGMERALWEASARAGRANTLHVTTDSWRDANGNLWEPNIKVPVDIPALKISKQLWVIGSVTYRRDETGTHADLEICPPEAYAVEPILLQPTLEGPNGGAQSAPAGQ